MATTKEVAIELPERQNLTVKVDPSSHVSTPAAKKVVAVIASGILIITIITFAISAIIAGVQLYVGRKYADSCTIDWHIPHYLVVAGTCGLVVVVAGIVVTLLEFKVAKDVAEEREPNTGVMVGLGCIGCLIVILVLFLFVWFIFGCYWVFRVWNDVQYIRPTESTYCHPFLYRFAFWILFISIILHFVKCGRSCSTTGGQLKALKAVIATNA